MLRFQRRWVGLIPTAPSNMPNTDPEKVKAWHRKWYQEHKEQFARKARKRLRLLKKRVQELKSTTPCADCKKCYPYYIMDPDHLHNKKERISIMVQRGRAWNDIAAELKKCDIVCANCHRARTWKRMKKLRSQCRHGTAVMYTRWGCHCRYCTAAYAKLKSK